MSANICAAVRRGRFLGEVRDNGGYGYAYRTHGGETGIVWLVYPEDTPSGLAGRLSVLGEYLRIDAAHVSNPDRTLL